MEGKEVTEQEEGAVAGEARDRMEARMEALGVEAEALPGVRVEARLGLRQPNHQSQTTRVMRMKYRSTGRTFSWREVLKISRYTAVSSSFRLQKITEIIS